VINPRTWHGLVLLAVVVALALRLPQLAQRPMHTDEAVHALKFGPLLEEGHYRYDSHEYHGPTLNYLTLIPAWLTGKTALTDVTEVTLRIVPAICGILLVLMPVWLVRGMGWPAAAWAALLMAISPAMVYYSRYYIMEMLLIVFTFGVMVCGYRYVRSKHLGWALGTGAFLGAMHATKETFLIACGALVLAVALTAFLEHRRIGPAIRAFRDAVKPAHAAGAVVVGLAVSALFYSSFLSHPQGIIDSITAYKTYLHRAGANTLHLHPWYWYLKMLLYAHYGDGPRWTEGLILLLAAIAMAAGLRGRPVAGIDPRWLRFLAFYTLIMTVLYAVIPYKTPWNLLGFFHGMILLAGAGVLVLWNMMGNRRLQIGLALLLAAAGAHLGWQAWRGSFVYGADPANPYVYAHSAPDIVAVAHRVHEVALSHPDRLKTPVDVIFPGDDYWPLPWYLRDMPNVGWRNKVAAGSPAAPIIITVPVYEQALMHQLYMTPPPGERKLYVPLFDTTMELRPQVEVRGYVTHHLWERFSRRQEPHAGRTAP